MTYVIIGIAVAVITLACYCIDRLAKVRTNLEALNDYAIASFERLVHLEAIIDDLLDIDEEEPDADEA